MGAFFFFIAAASCLLQVCSGVGEPRPCHSNGYHEHGETWTTPDIGLGGFKKLCNNGNDIIIACIGSKWAKHAEIQLNQTIWVDGFWFRCSNKGKYVYLEQEDYCSYNGNRIKINGKTTINKNTYLCNEHGLLPVGCLIKKGNEQVELKVNTWVVSGSYNHSCIKNRDNSVTYEKKPYLSKIIIKQHVCLRKGQVFKPGESWMVNSIKFGCKEGGKVDIHCVSPGGYEIPLNSGISENNMIYKCYRKDGFVHFSSYKCEGSSSSCNPDNNPHNLPISNTK